MNFMKGVIVGTMVSAGIMMIYNDTMGSSRKMMMKKGKQMAKKMGIM